MEKKEADFDKREGPHATSRARDRTDKKSHYFKKYIFINYEITAEMGVSGRSENRGAPIRLIGEGRWWCFFGWGMVGNEFWRKLFFDFFFFGIFSLFSWVLFF